VRRWLASRLLARLRPCPASSFHRARSTVSQAANRGATTLTLDMDSGRAAMDERASVLSLTFEQPAGRGRVRATRVLRSESPARLLVALALPPQLIN